MVGALVVGASALADGGSEQMRRRAGIVPGTGTRGTRGTRNTCLERSSSMTRVLSSRILMYTFTRDDVPSKYSPEDGLQAAVLLFWAMEQVEQNHGTNGTKPLFRNKLFRNTWNNWNKSWNNATYPYVYVISLRRTLTTDP